MKIEAINLEPKPKKEDIEPEYKIGDLVVIKSYHVNDNIIVGDPLHVPPIMVVVSVEIENKKKKTHDNVLGDQIAERIKYKLMWFDNKKSEFVQKIMYETFLKRMGVKVEQKEIINFVYEYGGVAKFRTSEFELLKQKKSTSQICSSPIGKDESKITNKENIKHDSLVTFACPDLVVTGIKVNEEADLFDDFGVKKKNVPKRLIKVMWFNPILQKYSEFELPQECLENKLLEEKLI